jgi:hypothetical protein
MNADSKSQPPKVGRPFRKGDPRINRSGRPKTFEELRRTADMIASEMVPGPNGEMITRGELLLRSWIRSKNPLLQRSFVEYWVGKPPEKIETDELQPKTQLILHYGHEMPASTVKASPSENDDHNSTPFTGKN